MGRRIVIFVSKIFFLFFFSGGCYFMQFVNEMG